MRGESRRRQARGPVSARLAPRPRGTRGASGFPSLLPGFSDKVPALRAGAQASEGAGGRMARSAVVLGLALAVLVAPAAFSASLGAGPSAPARRPETAPAAAPPSPACGVAQLPPRRPDAATGSEFTRRTDGMTDAERQAAAVAEVRRGNVPDFLRQLRPVWLRADGDPARAVRLCVSPDYLAVGSDRDFLRVPLGYPAATRIAAEFGFVLPTRKIVDAIFAQSDYRLTPQPLPPGPQMRSAAYSALHQRRVEAQRAGLPLGALIAGHKKDVVLTNRLLQLPDRVAIYGWHRRNGEPIQPLSTVHGLRYADYSHGLRLVDGVAWVAGRQRSLVALLEDPQTGPILTYEGEVPAARLIESGRAAQLGRVSCSSESPGGSCGGYARP